MGSGVFSCNSFGRPFDLDSYGVGILSGLPGSFGGLHAERRPLESQHSTSRHMQDILQ